MVGSKKNRVFFYIAPARLVLLISRLLILLSRAGADPWRIPRGPFADSRFSLNFLCWWIGGTPPNRKWFIELLPSCCWLLRDFGGGLFRPTRRARCAPLLLHSTQKQSGKLSPHALLRLVSASNGSEGGERGRKGEGKATSSMQFGNRRVTETERQMQARPGEIVKHVHNVVLFLE